MKGVCDTVIGATLPETRRARVSAQRVVGASGSGEGKKEVKRFPRQEANMASHNTKMLLVALIYMFVATQAASIPPITPPNLVRTVLRFCQTRFLDVRIFCFWLIGLQESTLRVPTASKKIC
jgi:hypothetical protein